MTEYQRLTELARLLHGIAQMLRMKGRARAADVMHDEAVHFSVERDIARAVAASEADGRPWHVYGMTDACRDCGATGDFHGLGRTSPVFADIFHDDGCPAATGAVTWAPVPVPATHREEHHR